MSFGFRSLVGKPGKAKDRSKLGHRTDLQPGDSSLDVGYETSHYCSLYREMIPTAIDIDLICARCRSVIEFVLPRALDQAVPGQQLVDAVDLVVGDAVEDIGDPDLRVGVVEPGGLGQGVGYGGGADGTAERVA